MLKKRLGKKGDWEIWLIILQPVIIMVFLAAFGLWIYNLSQANVLEQMYYSKDVPLSVNAVYAAPADYHFTYAGGSVGDFNYMFGTQIIQVSGEKYYYADDLFYRDLFPGLTASFKPAGNYLELDSNGLGLSASKSIKFNKKLKYGYLNTKNNSWTDKIIALKGEDYQIIQFWINDGLPYKSAEAVADSDVHLEFKMVEGRDLVAYIDFETAEKSRKLASIIMNRIIGRNEVNKINIYFTEINDIKEAGVILEIGKELQLLVSDVEESFAYYYGGSNE